MKPLLYFAPSRMVVSSVVLIVLSQVTLPAAGQSYGTKVANYAKSKTGKRVGSGECAHLATECLRVAGAEFRRSGMPDYPASGDYTWGAFVKELRKSGSRVTDSCPSCKCAVGDILQYRLGTGSSKTHHTAIVAAVSSTGMPTYIYQQNYNRKREVTRDKTNLVTLLSQKGGYIRVFRAKAPVYRDRIEFTLVNNASAGSINYKINGTNKSIGGRNVASGFQSYFYKPHAKVTVGGRTTTIVHRRAYEFYVSNGVIRLRML